MLSAGEIVFKSTATDYPIPNVQPENIHAENIVQTEHAVFKNAYVCTCMNVNNGKRGHEFERVQGVIYRRVWGEEREREMI